MDRPTQALTGRVRADTAAIIFERAWRSKGRDEAFVHPRPDQLPRLAEPLHVGGVRHVLVVVPHAPALLPQALQATPVSLAGGWLSRAVVPDGPATRAACACTASGRTGGETRLAGEPLPVARLPGQRW